MPTSARAATCREASARSAPAPIRRSPATPSWPSAGYPLTMVVNGRAGMPPFGDLLTDQQVAAVVNYVRSHFGNRICRRGARPPMRKAVGGGEAGPPERG